jgi:hypothetical protein
MVGIGLYLTDYREGTQRLVAGISVPFSPFLPELATFRQP